MTVASYTGEINTNGEWATIASLTSFIFVEDTPYWIQVQNIADIKIANAEFTLQNEKFKYTQLEDDIYIKTNERVVLTILETTESSGGSITVDSELSNSSTNPVQNKVITTSLGDKADTDLSNLSTSGYDAIFLNAFKTDTKDEITFDSTSSDSGFTNYIWTATKNGFINLVFLGNSGDFIQFYGYKNGNFGSQITPRVRVTTITGEAYLYYPCIAGVTYRVTCNSGMTVAEKYIFYWNK